MTDLTDLDKVSMTDPKGSVASFVQFNSIEELENEITAAGMAELMTLGVHASMDAMFELGKHNSIPVDDPRHEWVEKLFIHQMINHFMYEIGYTDDVVKRTTDYAAKDLILKLNKADPDEIRALDANDPSESYNSDSDDNGFMGGTREVDSVDSMDIGSSFAGMGLKINQMPVSARRPRKKTKYDFTHLTKRAKKELAHFKDLERGLGTFLIQYVKHNKFDILKQLGALGLSYIGASDILQIACLLISFAPKFAVKASFKRLGGVSPTLLASICAAAGVGGSIYKQAISNGLARAPKAATLTAVEAGSRMAVEYVVGSGLAIRLTSFIELTVDGTGIGILSWIPLLSASAMIIMNGYQEFKFLFSVEQKMTWLRALLGKSNDDGDYTTSDGLSDVERRVQNLEKIVRVTNFFESAGDLKGWMSKQIHDIREYVKKTTTENLVVIGTMEATRSKEKRKWYTEEDRTLLSDMISKAEDIIDTIKVTSEAVTEDVRFKKVLQGDRDLSRFDQFYDSWEKLKARPINEQPCFRIAAESLAAQLKTLDLENDRVQAVTLARIYNNMERLAELAFERGTPPVLTSDERKFVNDYCRGEEPDANAPAPARGRSPARTNKRGRRTQQPLMVDAIVDAFLARRLAQQQLEGGL